MSLFAFLNVGPHVGALFGALVYQFFIGNNWSQSVVYHEQILIVETLLPPEIDVDNVAKMKETRNV